MTYGKFETAEELLKGYNELEKVFTQKCQQLSVALAENQALTKSINEGQATAPAEQVADVSPKQSDGTNVETSPSVAEQSTTVDSTDTVPQVGVQSADLSGHAPAEPTLTEESVQQFLLDNPTFAAKLVGKSQMQTPEQLKQFVVDNAVVIEKILHPETEEFAPKVMSGGGNVSMALPSRPKTIKEASEMAKDLF